MERDQYTERRGRDEAINGRGESLPQRKPGTLPGSGEPTSAGVASLGTPAKRYLPPLSFHKKESSSAVSCIC